MDTKRAVKFLEECQDNIELQEKGYDEELIRVIELLHRGEKYEKMWGELKKYDGRLLGSGLIDDCLCPEDPKDIATIMDDFKKRYFPKEFSDDKLSECVNAIIKVIKKGGFTCEEIAKRLIPKD